MKCLCCNVDASIPYQRQETTDTLISNGFMFRICWSMWCPDAKKNIQDRCLPTLRYLVLWWQGQQVFGLVVNRSQWHTKQYHLASSYDLPVRWGWDKDSRIEGLGVENISKIQLVGRGSDFKRSQWYDMPQVRTKSRRWRWQNDFTWLRHAQLNKFWLYDGRVWTKLCRISGHFVSEKFWKCDSFLLYTFLRT